MRRPLHYVLWQGRKLRLVGRVGMQICAVNIGEYPVSKGDIVEVRIFRFSADSRIRRYYFENGSLKNVRGITDKKLNDKKASAVESTN